MKRRKPINGKETSSYVHQIRVLSEIIKNLKHFLGTPRSFQYTLKNFLGNNKKIFLFNFSDVNFFCKKSSRKLNQITQ